MDRREPSGWTDPRVIVATVQVFVALGNAFIAFLGLCVLIGGGLLGTYVVVQTRNATSEVNNQTLVGEVQKMRDTLNGVAGDIKELNRNSIAQEGKIEAQDKIAAKHEQDIGVLTLKIENIEKTFAEMKGRMSK